MYLEYNTQYLEVGAEWRNLYREKIFSLDIKAKKKCIKQNWFSKTKTNLISGNHVLKFKQRKTSWNEKNQN